jgi:hypothetical protein
MGGNKKKKVTQKVWDNFHKGRKTDAANAANVQPALSHSVGTVVLLASALSSQRSCFVKVHAGAVTSSKTSPTLPPMPPQMLSMTRGATRGVFEHWSHKLPCKLNTPSPWQR